MLNIVLHWSSEATSWKLSNKETNASMHNPLYKEYIYSHNNPTNPTTCLELDWSNPNKMLNSLNLFTPKQQHLFDVAYEKQRNYRYGFEKGNYFENIYPIIASDHPLSSRIVCCGMPRFWGGTGSCQKWRLCSHCAYIKQKKALDSYLPSFYRHSFIFTTISFTGGIYIQHPKDLSEIVDVWNCIDSAVKRLKQTDRIQGAYYVNEISIKSFLPLVVLPHTHCIFHIDALSEFIESELTGYMIECRAAGRYTDGLTPSIKIERFESEQHFANVLQYETKAIDFSTPYYSGLLKTDNMENGLIKLNTEFKTFLYGWLDSTYRKTAIHRIGTMHGSSRSYVGVKRKLYKPKERPRLTLASAPEWASL